MSDETAAVDALDAHDFVAELEEAVVAKNLLRAYGVELRKALGMDGDAYWMDDANVACIAMATKEARLVALRAVDLQARAIRQAK